MSSRYGLSQAEQGNVLQHLIQGGDLSQWGIMSAVTRTAEDAENYDRATEIETIGGKMLTMGKSAWQEIARAA